MTALIKNGLSKCRVIIDNLYIVYLQCGLLTIDLFVCFAGVSSINSRISFSLEFNILVQLRLISCNYAFVLQILGVFAYKYIHQNKSRQILSSAPSYPTRCRSTILF